MLKLKYCHTKVKMAWVLFNYFRKNLIIVHDDTIINFYSAYILGDQSPEACLSTFHMENIFKSHSNFSFLSGGYREHSQSRIKLYSS